MCGRYSLALGDPVGLRTRFPLGDSVEIRTRYNVAPGDEVLAVTTTRDGAPRGELLHWGLVPAWAKDARVGVKTINARAETLTERPAYRDAFARFRCLIPADGFYEWQRAHGGRKQPFRITRPDRAPFAFAGLWSRWRSPEGAQEIRSCTIITSAARGVIRPIHDRMPVILAPEHEAMWLDHASPAPLLRELLEDASDPRLELTPVGPAVSDARYDGPDCLLPVPAGLPAALIPEQTSLF